MSMKKWMAAFLGRASDAGQERVQAGKRGSDCGVWALYRLSRGSDSVSKEVVDRLAARVQ